MKKKILYVIDMQNDFIDGTLGSKEAKNIVNKVAEKIRNFDGIVITTRDTHQENYLNTQEGKKLPVEHCIEGTNGWQINSSIQEALNEKNCEDVFNIDKKSFGYLKHLFFIKTYLDLKENDIESIELVGLCTDICVISNAMILKASYPEVPIFVDSSCCAGVTVQSHENALEAMKMCQINVI